MELCITLSKQRQIKMPRKSQQELGQYKWNGRVKNDILDWIVSCQRRYNEMGEWKMDHWQCIHAMSKIRMIGNEDEVAGAATIKTTEMMASDPLLDQLLWHFCRIQFCFFMNPSPVSSFQSHPPSQVSLSSSSLRHSTKGWIGTLLGMSNLGSDLAVRSQTAKSRTCWQKICCTSSRELRCIW